MHARRGSSKREKRAQTALATLVPRTARREINRESANVSLSWRHEDNELPFRLEQMYHCYYTDFDFSHKSNETMIPTYKISNLRLCFTSSYLIRTMDGEFFNIS